MPVARVTSGALALCARHALVRRAPTWHAPPPTAPSRRPALGPWRGPWQAALLPSYLQLPGTNSLFQFAYDAELVPHAYEYQVGFVAKAGLQTTPAYSQPRPGDIDSAAVHQLVLSARADLYKGRFIGSDAQGSDPVRRCYQKGAAVQAQSCMSVWRAASWCSADPECAGFHLFDAYALHLQRLSNGSL
jgi:hypothetical protein